MMMFTTAFATACGDASFSESTDQSAMSTPGGSYKKKIYTCKNEK